MRSFFLGMSVMLLGLMASIAQQAAAPAAGAAQGFTLTLTVEGVDQRDGNIGVLIFNSPKGWAEDRFAAFRTAEVPAHPGTVTITIPNLPAGEYAVSLAHDVNKNRKLDRNFIGKPTEQWGLSNNPHTLIKTPPYDVCKFALSGDMQVHIKMQQ
ncbi:MAG TPA: DUF2141 domain-containing protein [Terriglobales bacterium]|nr:DUF2141 domain-containing protein [Terriglobales bacterium]